MRAHLIVAMLASVFMSSTSFAETQNGEARIGVLAYRGSDELRQNWAPLTRYLEDMISGWSFVIVPMTLSSASEQIKSGQLDFVVTNPGHFVTLDEKHRMSVLASRSQRKSNGQLSTEFASTIITHKETGIESLEDVAGKSVVAIGPEAFGGFQVAWYAFDQMGIDLFSDASNLIFVGFPMDQVVARVVSKEIDVGIVRSGLIEDLVSEGRLRLDDLVLLNTNVVYNHPDFVSTNLYPEWPFAALATTDPDLKNQVALGLLQSGVSPLAKAHGLDDAWTAPLAYHSVREVTEAYQARLAKSDHSLGHWIARGVWALIALSFVSGALWWWRVQRPVPKRGRDGSETVGEKEGLTPRENEVLTLIAEGLSTKEIAIDLGISPKTVEFHRANLLRKFGARTSSQLVAMAT